ncbi:CBM35 domain-containing protein [Streptomyces colonosanans]|uniref:Carbohydrate-binding protein n=1 Tax=Streptomyces colonosanans TaxID=1428652 RepID=A0A1S2NTV3_9ACTN|nr:CBM35 domain-containing protein [Streptomyces colonosanans]OIJ84877.1 carbohydrate-binding protein [Streptomyces colonosanans]
MTSGDNGASTPEDDDPFGYLYADGQANGAQPPTGGYGYPGSVNRVRAVGQRQYGQPQAPAAPYGQVPQQQAYGQPNAHYAAPETMPGGAPPSRQAPMGPGGNGRGRGPNTKVLLIAAVAVVAAVVIGISVAMLGGDDKNNQANNQPSDEPTTSQTASPGQSATTQQPTNPAELPKSDAKALKLEGGAAEASDVKGAKADGGTYVGGFNQVGAAMTWTVDVPSTGKYTLHTDYGVPGADANATLAINGTPQTNPLALKNWTNAPEGDWEKGWTNSFNYIQLNKGTNTIRISCEQGNQCNANFDQLWLTSGWSK